MSDNTAFASNAHFRRYLVVESCDGRAISLAFRLAGVHGDEAVSTPGRPQDAKSIGV